MVKLILNNVADLTNFTTSQTTINNNSAATSVAMENTLSRDGTTPNTMGANFDMNGFRIFNLPAPATVNEPARLVDVVTNPLITVPPVGTSGATVPLNNGNNIFSGVNTFTQDYSFSKTGSALSGNYSSTAGRVLETYQGPTGVAFYLKDTTASTDLKYFNIDTGSGLLYFRSLTDVGAIKQEFFNLNSSTSTMNLSVPLIGAVNANANYVATTFSNNNTGASAAVSNSLGSTNAGGMSFQAVSNAGGGFSLWRWTGSGGLFIDQQNAAGSITFRTGVTPNNVLELTTSGGAVISTPGAVTSALTFIDTSSSGLTWTWGPRVGTGSASLYGFNGGSFGTIFYLNGSTGALIGGAAVLSQGATQGIGYSTGAGGTVTQGTNRTTGVTINKVSGAITLFSQVNTAISQATAQSFTVTNSAVAATDSIIVSQKSGTDKYEIFVTNVAAGSFQITNYAVAGTTNEAPVFNFNVIKGVTS